METEERLLTRIHQGDRKAQQELYRRFAGTAMAVAMRYVADTEVARDVLQESFVKVFSHVKDFEHRGEGTLKAWVMRVVSNEAINVMRQRQRHLFTELPEEEGTPDEEPDVGGISMEVLQRMIEQLPEGYRIVFNLYVFEQKSHKEIAALLGIKENSSASQFLRAKRMLARQIQQYQQQQL